MRPFLLVTASAFLLASLCVATSPPERVLYRLDFDSAKDVTLLDEDKDKRQGLFVNVRFTITQIEQTTDDVYKDYKIVIKEDGHVVRQVDVPRPVVSHDLTVVLVVDKSGSMLSPADDSDKVSKLVALREAARRFIDRIGPTARLAVLEFSDTVVTPRPFSRDKAQARATIDGLEAGGETAVFDATFAAIATLEADGALGRRAVVVLTDGIDNSSRRRVDEVIQRAKAGKTRWDPKGVPLYMLGLGREVEGELGAKVMSEMATATGGEYFHAKNRDSLVALFEKLSIRITEIVPPQHHEITFPSLRQVRDGRARHVTLELVRRGQVVQRQEGAEQVRGLVVPELNHFVYVFLLVLIGVLIALPAVFRKSARPSAPL